MLKKLLLTSCFVFCFTGILLAAGLPLELPPKVYAVPGTETNIYFDNIVLTTNPRNYVFDVSCAKGRNAEKRWSFTPSDKDVGTYTWKVEVFDEKNKIVAWGETKIIVSPKNAGAGKNFSLLLIGDSLTDQSIYPAALYKLMAAPGNPAVTLIGSHGGRGRKPGETAHEGYGGWTWKNFCTRWTNGKDYRAKSKFLKLENGKPALDFKAYISKYGNGKNPDFVTIMLGTNDIYSCNDSNIKQQVQELFLYADRFISAIKRDAPNTKIGIALTVPPAAGQDAFGNNYKCGQTRWQFKRNQFYLVKAMIKKFGNTKVKNVSLIPVFAGLDCENNFPIANKKLNSRNSGKVARHYNAVHPAKSGYLQIADFFYCWLKYELNK